MYKTYYTYCSVQAELTYVVGIPLVVKSIVFDLLRYTALMILSDLNRPLVLISVSQYCRRPAQSLTTLSGNN